MAFADSFAECMAGAGIQVDASGIPDSGTFGPVLDYLKQYVQGLDANVQAGLDAATTDDPVAAALAESDVGAIDPAYISLLHAFDAATGFPLSLCLQWCDHCFAQAQAADQAQAGTPA
jgi:hypothetical protein